MRDKVLRLHPPRLSMLALASALLLAPMTASAAERDLSRTEVLKLAQDRGALCEGWREADTSCQSLLFLEVAAGDKVTETDRMQIARQPDVAVGIRDDVTLDGAAVCTTVDFGPDHTVILMDGEPSDDEIAGQFLIALKASLSAYDGRRACETFRRDDVTGVIRSSTTIDGKPAPELDSVYRLLHDDARVSLRPLIESDGSEQHI